MAVSLGQLGSYAQTSGTSLSLNYPTNVVGDVLLLQIVGVATINDPSGWTRIASVPDQANANTYVYWRAVDTAPFSGAVTVTIPFGGNTMGWISSWKGASLSTPTIYTTSQGTSNSLFVPANVWPGYIIWTSAVANSTYGPQSVKSATGNWSQTGQTIQDAPSFSVFYGPIANNTNSSLSANNSGTSSSYSVVALGLSPAGSSGFNGTANLSGSGSLAPAGQASISTSANLLGSGTLSAISSPATSSSVSFSATGALSALGAKVTTISADLSGAGSIATVGSPRPSASVNLSGAGNLTALIVPTPRAAVSLSGLGNVTVQGSAIATGNAAFSSLGGLISQSASGVVDFATLKSTGTLSAQGSPTLKATRNLSGTGVLNTTSSAVGYSGLADYSGSGLLSAVALAIPMVSFSGSGILVGVGSQLVKQFANFSTSGQLTAVAFVNSITFIDDLHGSTISAQVVRAGFGILEFRESPIQARLI